MQTEKKELTDGELLLGIGNLIASPIGPRTEKLLFLKQNLAAVLDGLRVLSIESDIDDLRRKKIYDTEEAVKTANEKLEAAFTGLY